LVGEPTAPAHESLYLRRSDSRPHDWKRALYSTKMAFRVRDVKAVPRRKRAGKRAGQAHPDVVPDQAQVVKVGRPCRREGLAVLQRGAPRPAPLAREVLVDLELALCRPGRPVQVGASEQPLARLDKLVCKVIA